MEIDFCVVKILAVTNDCTFQATLWSREGHEAAARNMVCIADYTYTAVT